MTAAGLLALAGAVTAESAHAGGLFDRRDGFADGLNGFPAPLFFNWTGLYFGGHVGAASGDLDLNTVDAPFVELDDLIDAPGSPCTDTNTTNDNGARCRFSQDRSGVIAGAHLGFNQQVFNFVFGFEASISGTDLDDSSTRTFRIEENGDIDQHVIGIETKTDWLGLATLRLGYAFNRWLVYLKGGYATGNVKIRGDQQFFDQEQDGVGTPVLETTTHFASSERHHGYHIGAGFEYAFPTTSCCTNVIFGIEYNFIDLDSERHSGAAHEFNDDGESEGERRRFNIDVDPDGIHTIKARLSYKFGCCEAVAPLPPPLK